jgi:hypothetical protein
MPCTIRFKADLAKLVGRDSMTQDEFLAWLATGDNLAKTKELTAPPTQVKGELSEGDKANLEQIAKEVGKNFREVQNVYSKYGEGKPLSEITVEDYRKAEEKRGGEKVDDEAIGKKAGISPKNLKDLYNINRELFGLNRIQAFASAIAMDRMVGAMAKRAGVTKAEMYGRLDFVKDTEENILKADNALFQGTINGQEVSLKNIDVDVVNGFYSPIEKRLAETKIEKQSANKWLTVIGKGDEATWTGVKQWLESKNPQEQVSKSEIQQWMKDNRISVVEVVKGLSANSQRAKLKELGYTVESDGYIGVNIKDDEGELVEYDDVPKEAQKLLDEIRSIEYDDDVQKSGSTKFAQYQLEGEKENYKEVLVTLPKTKPFIIGRTSSFDTLEYTKNTYGINSIEYRNMKDIVQSELEEKGLKWSEIKTLFDDYESKPSDFKSTHFDEPNILVHLRMNTRTDANGNKVLFLEEVQSDWGQKGKKEGFVGDKQKELFNQFKYEALEVNGKILHTYSSADGEMVVSSSENKENARENAEEVARKNAEFLYTREVPSAPFVTDTNAWVKLGLKVALKEAVKQGATKIAWTTGEQQNERYDLSKSVDEVFYAKKEDGTFSISANKGDNLVFSEKNIKPERLEDYIGKELASKIIEDSKTRAQNSYKGNELKVGGKGMKGFYGSPTEGSLGIVGNVAKGLFKQEPKTTKILTNSAKLDKTFSVENRPNEPMGRTWLVIDEEGNVRGRHKTETEAENDAQSLYDGLFEIEKRSYSTQYSIDITPQLMAEVEKGLALFQREQGRKAMGAMVAADGRYVVYAITDPNVSTPLHELAHVFEHYLTEGERAVIIKNAGTDGWTTETSEYFARGFERYLAEGKSPIAALNKVFEKFKEWLTEIYNGIKGSDIDITLNTEMKRIYDAMLGKEKITIKNTELIKKQLVAFAKGLKQGIREGKINLKEYKAKIDSFNQTLKDALKDSGLSPQWQAKMIKYFGKIKTINNLNDALLDIDKLMESEEFAEAAERIKKAYKKLRKINKDRLTIADKNLISSIPQIKPRYLQDPLAWAEMLENIEKGLKQGGRRPDYKTISEMILAESQFAYDKEMAELKERTDEEWVNLSSDYEVLKTLGKLPPFVETKEQFEQYLRGVKTDEQLAKELEKQEAKEAKMSRTEELINEATWAFELDIKNNPEVLESMSARERGYYDILAKADFSKLSDVQLARLLNAFTNIKEFGDWAGVGDIAMLLSAKQAAESITPTSKSGRGIEYKKKSLNAFLRAIYNGSQVFAAQLRDKILTPWESRISKLKKKQDEVLEQVGKIINKNKLNKKDFIDISVFSFINDLLPNVDKLEQQKAILESLIESTQNMYKTFDYKGEGERKRRAEAMREKAISTAEAMKKFGLIQEYQVLPSGLKIFPKKEPNFGFQLNPKQKELYDFAVNKYAELKSGVEDFFKYQLNKQMEATDGYVARIAYKNFKTQEQKEETLKIDNYDSTNRFLSKKPSGRAKERVGGLKDGYYEMDFVEAFSKGYYDNLILAEAGDAYAYMTAIVNNTSKEMTESLGEDTTKVLIGKNGFINDIVQSDKNYGYVGKDFRSLFEKAQEFVLTNAASSILKRADQIVLQTIPSLLTSIIQHPKATMMAVKVLSGKNGNTDKLMERFTAYHRVLGGQKEFEKKILSLGKNKFIEAGEDVLETAQKLQGSEFMSYGDNLISLITSLAGYIAHQKLTGKIKNESDFDIDAASENIDGEGLAYGEQFSAGINNESNPANQAEILKKEGARLQWFLMSFNMNAHQNFLVAVKNIFTKGLDSETRNMNARIAAGYLAQAVTYRTLRILVSLAIAKGIEAALENDLDDDEEENKRLKKMLVTMGADIAISDLFLASQNVITQWAIKAALYGSWEIFSKYNLENLDATPEEKKKLEKETVLYDPKFNPILNPDLEVGAAGIVFGDVVEDMKNFARYSEMEKAKREVNPYARDMAFKYGLMIGGFGTLNKVYNGIVSQNKRDLRKIYELYDSFKTMNLPEITKLMRTDWRQYNNEERKEFAQLSTDIDTPLNNEGLPNYVFYALTKDQIPKYYDLKEKLTEMFDRGEFEILEELYSYKKNELLSSGKASTENVDMIINNFYKDPKNVKKAIQDIAFSKFVMNSDERKKMQKVKVTAKTK